MEKTIYSRRGFIGKCLGISSLAAVATFALTGCGQGKQQHSNEKEKVAGGENPCDDLSGLSETEKEQRKQFGYVNQSPVPGSVCGNCRLYLPPKSGEQCGGCLLFKGPVQASGYCTQYEVKS